MLTISDFYLVIVNSGLFIGICFSNSFFKKQLQINIGGMIHTFCEKDLCEVFAVEKMQGRRQRGGWGGFSSPSFWPNS
jgi:hypothetical protein